jgi:hypothetical protein
VSICRQPAWGAALARDPIDRGSSGQRVWRRGMWFVGWRNCKAEVCSHCWLIGRAVRGIGSARRAARATTQNLSGAFETCDCSE